MLDLVTQMSFYAFYHQHPMNQALHVLCVPLIILSVFIWGLYGPAYGIWNFSTVNLAGMTLFYTLLHPLAGISCGVMYLGIYYLARFMFTELGEEIAWWVGLVIHIAAWYIQVAIGHVHYEKRRPALLDSLFQSIVMAPFFVWIEVLFFFGFLPTFKTQLKEAVESIRKSRNA